MKALRKPLSLFMALLMCLGVFVGTGTTAFAAGETMTTYMIDLPRASDPNKAGWGHPALNFMGGWSTGENDSFSVHTQDAFNGRAIYCIEPGVGVNTGDQYTGRGEDFWDNYPSNLNPTIPPDTIKEYIGRIMTYGWQGNASTSWMSGDPEDASKIAGYIATQLLVWETVVGERDSQFNHVDANAQGKNNVTEYISADHPLYSEIFNQYSAIESAVKRHTMLPSFFSSTADAGAYELKWDGQQYSLTLTDTNGVLSDYTFSSSTTGLNFSVDGNQLTITSAQAIKGSVTVKAEKISAQRSGVVVWTDGITGGGKQDFATYGETVSDSMVGYLNLEVKTGNMKLIKTSEDGQVAGINFTITGEGYSATKTTNEAGEIDISDLNPGVYTVTEQSIDKYEPQETQRVTIVSGQTATVNFNNKLKRGSLEVTKTSEDGLVEGMTFHLYGTSLSGQPVDEYAVTDSSGVARFENVLIGTGYVLEEVDTPIRYVVPDSQTATIEWNEVTHKSVNNVLKKFRVTVTKSDVETGAPQGDGSLAGAVYGLYKGDTLIDSFTTDENGQFTTGYYVCDSDWTIREISPSEGYLLDSTIHKVGAEPELYTIELNDTANDVTEQVIKGDIAIIKHTDDGETQIETPESGAEFQVFLKSAGSYENARESERDVLVCDENGFAQSKKLPYNPFSYLKNDNDVQKMVTNLFKATTPKGSQSNDPFWDTAASMLLLALCFYLWYEAPEDEKNFPMVMEMLRAGEVREDDDSYQSPLDELFDRLEMRSPDHIAVKYYKDYRSGSAKTLKSIQITLASRLEKFNLSSVAALTATDELDLSSLGEKKVALFALIPDNDASFNFLVSLLYASTFQELFYSADRVHGGSLPTPVHFLMDEFANVSLPDDFDKLLATMRSRNISVSIIIQNIAQLKALFEKQWESIIGNCDEFLYLGGNETSTHKLISENYLGKSTLWLDTYGKSTGHSGSYSTNNQITGRELLTPDEVRMLDNNLALLFIRGEAPLMDEKYDLLKHPNIKYTTDGGAPVYAHGGTENAVADMVIGRLTPGDLANIQEPEALYELLSDEDMENIFQFKEDTQNETV